MKLSEITSYIFVDGPNRANHENVMTAKISSPTVPFAFLVMQNYTEFVCNYYGIYIGSGTSSNTWIIYVGTVILIIGAALSLFSIIFGVTIILNTRRRKKTHR